MPQFDPVVNRITRHMEATLKGIRKPAYAHDLTVRRVAKGGNVPQASQYPLAVLSEWMTSPINRASHDQSGWEQEYVIDAFPNQAEDIDEPLGDALQKLRADIERALTLDDDSRTRGGLAFDTQTRGAVPITAPGKLYGIRIRIAVQYYSQFNDPYRSAHSPNP